MFESIYNGTVTATQFFLMALTALLSGLIYAFIMSFRVRSSKRFFLVLTVIPFVVATVITFVKGNIGAGVAVGGGVFGLIRFRSAQGGADEIAGILIAMAAGIAYGMGYLGYGVAILLGLALLYFALALLPVFDHRSQTSDQLLRVTIPESLEYNGAFDEVFARYLKSWESVGVKTTGLGSMFRLSYRIRQKAAADEKRFLDELRTLNGNLEIAVTPFTEATNQL